MTIPDNNNDIAGVIAPPPLMALGVVVFGLLLDRLLPAYVLALLLPLTMRIIIGLPLLGIGCFLGVAAVNAFRVVETPVEPWKPSTALVTQGIFKWLRNPMYVGGLLILAGLAMLLASDWMLALTILLAPVIHCGVVMREERYLTSKFGEPYARYLAGVPRYGWPL
ncbi:MAG TPA: isoprenylcysteine carboxylmethyltransferase family protein [Pseudolabrys sp.]|nr:isoprenylcysteine carboxylmethyltransferase family protein [Pseudolabrys sp.]